MSRPLRILIADDHTVLRVGLKAFLEEQAEPTCQVVGQASSGEECVDLVARLRPDLVVLDVSMAGMGGLETAIELRRRGSRVRILVLTQHGEGLVARRLLEAGANGYVLKSARGEELMVALRAVAGGGTYVDPSLAAEVIAARTADAPPASDDEALARLTPRERQILTLVAQGRSNKEMAASLGVAVKTVMAHRANMMDKLGCHNRSKLVQLAMRTGLVPMEGD